MSSTDAKNLIEKAVVFPGDNPAAPSLGSRNEESDEEVLQRLSSLSPFEYERLRKDEARHLNVSVSILDQEVKRRRAQNSNEEQKGLAAIFPDVEPWADSVTADEILEALTGLFKRFAILPEHADTTLALWVIFTWCIDYVHCAPILTLSSPEKQCGKTTVLSILGKLVFKALPASHITAAALFRTIEALQPTLIIDEADTFINASDELKGIINSGHTRSSAFAIRTVGEDHNPKQFRTWGAKAIALIGKLPDTLHDRSIVIELRRKHPGEKTEKLRHVSPQIFDDLKRKILRFSQDHGASIKQGQPLLPSNISDRAADNWEPLLAIAELGGERWTVQSRQAASFLSNREKDHISLGNQLLLNTQHVFQNEGAEKIPTAKLIEALCEDSELPWLTYDRGTPITPRQLAKILDTYKIQSKNIKVEGNKVLKGFEKSQFEDAWSRYLPESSSENAATPLLSNQNKGSEEFSSATFAATNIVESATEQISKIAISGGVGSGVAPVAAYPGVWADKAVVSLSLVEPFYHSDNSEDGVNKQRQIDFEERAGIMEHEGRLDRREAERLSKIDVETS